MLVFIWLYFLPCLLLDHEYVPVVHFSPLLVRQLYVLLNISIFCYSNSYLR